MITKIANDYNVEKVRTFDKAMIEAAKTNKDLFEFEGKQYIVCLYGGCVQTLVDDRLLYRIFIEEDKKDTSIGYKLLKYL